MTDKEKLEKVKAEIKRLMKDVEIHSDIGDIQQDSYYDGRRSVLCLIRDFINSLQEKPVSEELEKEMNDFFLTMQVQDKEYINEDTFRSIARHFVDWQKEQLMKDADDYLVDDDNTIKKFYDTGGVVGKPIIFGSTPDSINVGDHVKVIVIKEK